MTNKESQLHKHGTRAAATTATPAENTSYPTTRRAPWTSRSKTTTTMKAKLTLKIYTLDITTTTTSVLISAKSTSKLPET